MEDKSYTELMKAGKMKKKQAKETYVMDLYIDMLLSEIHLKRERTQLSALIDQAIDERNKEKFIQLSNRYNLLCKRFGT